MRNFINIEDYDASIHREILDALVRDDKNAIEICEDRAISEMKCYLSKRYDCKAMFSAQGDERNQLVLMMAIDIAIYHIFSIHNPRNISQIRKDRYDRARDWLEAVADERISIEGVELLSPEERTKSSNFIITSNPKRHNHF